MTDVIIAATALHDHVAPMLAIAADLIERGEDVTVLTGSRFQGDVLATGARFAPLTGRADIDPALFRSPERTSLADFDRLVWDLEHVAVGTVEDQWWSLQRLLAEPGNAEAALISESGFWGVAPGLAGAPGIRPRRQVVIGVDPLAVSSRDLAPFGSGAAPATTRSGRERHARANAYSRDVLFATTQHRFESAMRRVGVTASLPFFFDCLPLLAESYLQLSIPELSYKRSDLPETISFVGVLPVQTSSDARLPGWWDDVITAEHVVVVSQGTVAGQDLGELILPTLEALADLPLLVVAVTGDSRSIVNVPANARIATFIPFAQLLPYADVLVGSGGYDGVQQALSYGVPLVLAGDSEERIEGNARTARTGAAINLQTQCPPVDDIRAAVITVLEQARFRRATEALADVYRATRPYESISRAVQGSLVL